VPTPKVNQRTKGPSRQRTNILDAKEGKRKVLKKLAAL